MVSPSPSASARDANEWRRSWRRTSSSPTRARTLRQASSSFLRSVPGFLPEMIQGLPERRGRAAKSLNADCESETTRAHAEKAFERFLASWEAKYPKAAECLAKDREELLACYDFSAARWQSLRTTNPIESTFATIRLRTAKTRNCLSEKTALSLVHQLAMSAEKRWRRLRGFHHLADVNADVRSVDGVDQKETGGRAAGFRTAIYKIWPQLEEKQKNSLTHYKIAIW